MAVIYAVGVGPGDPELLTRKAERVVGTAEVILAPVSNPSEPSVALETVRQFIDEKRQRIILHQFPMTSDRSRLMSAWQEGAALIAGHAEAGRSVAFITIGDPLLYSTFIYLLRILREQWPHLAIEIVPGISSINAAAGEALIPLAEGDEKLVVIPATAGIEKIGEGLARNETVVILKVRPLFPEIIQLLRATGRSDGVIFVERVGSNRQKIFTDFEEIASHTPDYLSLMIIR